jgi:hypothetical protein
MNRRPAEPVLLPEIERELLRAARRQLDDEHLRMRRVRAGALAVVITLLLTPPSAAALTVSPSIGTQIIARGI